MNRRKCLQLLCGAGALPGQLFAGGISDQGQARRIHLHRFATGQTAVFTFWRDGWYDAEGMSQIEHFMKDVLTGDHMPIDPRLVDVLHSLAVTVKYGGPIGIMQGFVSPRSFRAQPVMDAVTADLEKWHMLGRAIDFTLPVASLSVATTFMSRYFVGGVGLSRQNHILHIDTGERRFVTLR
jgi:uncharacterized protein YcbK (DUF882 family)